MKSGNFLSLINGNGSKSFTNILVGKQRMKDSDRDGVPNIFDCQPYNKYKDSFLSSLESSRGVTTKSSSSTANTSSKSSSSSYSGSSSSSGSSSQASFLKGLEKSAGVKTISSTPKTTTTTSTKTSAPITTSSKSVTTTSTPTTSSFLKNLETSAGVKTVTPTTAVSKPTNTIVQPVTQPQTQQQFIQQLEKEYTAKALQPATSIKTSTPATTSTKPINAVQNVMQPYKTNIQTTNQATPSNIFNYAKETLFSIPKIAIDTGKNLLTGIPKVAIYSADIANKMSYYKTPQTFESTFPKTSQALGYNASIPFYKDPGIQTVGITAGLLYAPAIAPALGTAAYYGLGSYQLYQTVKNPSPYNVAGSLLLFSPEIIRGINTGRTYLSPKYVSTTKTAIEGIPSEIPGRKTLSIGVVQPGLEAIKEPLSKQIKVAGTTQDVVSAQRGLFGIKDLFNPEKEISKPIPVSESYPGLSKSSLSKITELKKGNLSPAEISKLDIQIKAETGSKGLLESSFFADPYGRVRISRLGLQETKLASIKDIASGNVRFTKQTPQVLIFEQQRIPKFPSYLKDVQAKIESNKPLTQLEQSRLMEWQLKPTGEFKTPGFLSPEPEVSLAPGEIIVKKSTPAVSVIQGRRVEIVRAGIKMASKDTRSLMEKARAGKITEQESITLSKNLAKETGFSSYNTKPYLSPASIISKLGISSPIISSKYSVSTISSMPEVYSSMPEVYSSIPQYTSNKVSAVSGISIAPNISGISNISTSKNALSKSSSATSNYSISNIFSKEPSISISKPTSYSTPNISIISPTAYPRTSTTYPTIPKTKPYPITKGIPTSPLSLGYGTPTKPRSVSVPTPTKPTPEIPITKPTLLMNRKSQKPNYNAYLPEAWIASTKQHKAHWRTLSEVPMTKEAALASTARFVDETISARGKVVQIRTERPPQNPTDDYFKANRYKFRTYKIKRGVKHPMNQYNIIERRRYRLDTPWEVRKIQREKFLTPAFSLRI